MIIFILDILTRCLQELSYWINIIGIAVAAILFTISLIAFLLTKFNKKDNSGF